MIYCITELTIHADGTKLRYKYHFEDKDCAIKSLRVLSDNRLKEYERGWIRESWLDLECMYPTFHDLDGELMIDGTERKSLLLFST